MSEAYVDSYRERFARFTHELRVAGSLPAYMLLARHGSNETRGVPTDTYVLSSLVGARPAFAWMDAGDGRLICSGALGTNIWQSPGSEAVFHVEGTHDVLILALPGPATRAYVERAGVSDPGVLERGAFEEFADPAVSRAMRTIWTDARRGGTASSLLVDASVWTILSRILDRAQALPRLETASLDDAALSNVIEFMEEGMTGTVTSEALAELAGLPPPVFSRAFEEKMGHSPGTYLAGRRIARAAELLAETDMPSRQVALACGFASKAGLTTAFRKATGATPSQYRRRMRG